MESRVQLLTKEAKEDAVRRCACVVAKHRTRGRMIMEFISRERVLLKRLQKLNVDFSTSFLHTVYELKEIELRLSTKYPPQENK